MRSVFRVASAFVVVAPLILSSGEVLASYPDQYAALIATHARTNGVPVELASAVVRYESNFNPRVTGRAGEIGLMQIKLQTARGIGYRGTRRGLYDPATNIAWGMKYLGQARQLAGGNECGTLSRYNGGLFIRHLVRGYCRQVIAKSQLHGGGAIRFARNQFRGNRASVPAVEVALTGNRAGIYAATAATNLLASLNGGKASIPAVDVARTGNRGGMYAATNLFASLH
jgi:hypothetical protein